MKLFKVKSKDVKKGEKTMNILVVNGSPKGKYSVTLQTSNWLQIKFPNCKFDVIHAGQIIKKLERDFSEAKEKLEKQKKARICIDVNGT